MNKHLLFASLALAVTLGALAPTQASAASTIEGVDALKEWNLIVFNDLRSSSEVEGRTFVGGNLSGNSSNYQVRTPALSASNTPGLTVVGNVSGGHKNLDRGSGANVGGNVSSGFNLNGGIHTVNVGGAISNTNVNQNIINANLNATNPAFLAGLTGQRDALIDSLTELSLALSGLGPSATASIAHNRATFNAMPDGNGLAVFTLTAADLNSFGEIQFNRNGADTVIVNVDGAVVTLNDNFLGNAANLGQNVIWNFHNATDLSLTTSWRGSVLAPLANGTIGNYIEGSAVFNNLNQNGEIHLGTYAGNFTPPTGAVPEPSTWAMLLLGFGALGSLVRRRRSGHATGVLAAA
jgi:choice-of-anchor A domain-containing protein